MGEKLFLFFLDRKKRNLVFLILGTVLVFSVIFAIALFSSPKAENIETTDETGKTETLEVNKTLPPETESDLTEEVSETQPAPKEILAHGIDVSKWQGAIQWEEVAKAEVDFAFVRLGYRGENGVLYEDENARYNLQQAAKNGILTGVYFYSRATTPQQAREEAQWILERIGGFAISYPVVFDWELGNAVSTVTAQVRTDLALSFLREIENGGYHGMLYAPISEFENPTLWQSERILKEFPVWIARYQSELHGEMSYPDTELDYAIWQYTDQGIIPGIDKKVDRNVSYVLYPFSEAKKPDQNPSEYAPPSDFRQTFQPVSYRVTAKDEVNLRSTPSIEGEIVGTLKKGEFLLCTGRGDMGWSRLDFSGQTVYAVTSYLTETVLPEPEPDPALGHTFQNVQESVTAKIEVNLRSTPSSEGEIVGTLKNGEVLIRTGLGDRGWDRLTYNGNTVYAVSSYLTPAEPF